MPTVTVSAAGETTTVNYAAVAPRPLWGLAHGANSPATSYEATLGKPAGPLRAYFESNQATQGVAFANSNAAAGRNVWLSFKMPYSWARMAAGEGDAWAQGIINGLAAVPAPVMLTWHHEPEGDEADIVPYLAAAAHLATLSAGVPNLRVGPIFTAYDWLYGPRDSQALYGQYTFNTKIPVWNLGDFAGFDVYCYYGTKRGGKFWEFGPTYFSKIATLAAGWGVPWAIGEFGQSDDSYAVPAQQAQLPNAYQSAVDLGNCLALCYFDTGYNSTTNISDGKPAWPLSGGKLAAWLAVAAASPPQRQVW